MSRETKLVAEERRFIAKIETRKCDVCQIELSDENDEWNQNELLIFLNPDECVNSRVRLDLCSDCLDPIWTKICLAINANPDDELRIGQD